MHLVMLGVGREELLTKHLRDSHLTDLLDCSHQHPLQTILHLIFRTFLTTERHKKVARTMKDTIAEV